MKKIPIIRFHLLIFLLLIAASSATSQIIVTNNFFLHNTKVIEGESQYIWIGTQENGIIQRDTTGSILNSYQKEKSDLISNHINCIAIDKHGNKWIGTDQGISIFNGFEWKSITTSDGLSSNNIQSIVFSDSNYAWIGTDNGLDKYNMEIQSVEKHFSQNNGLSSNIISTLALDEQHQLWIGTINGVNIFDGNEFSQLQVADSINLSWVNDIHIDKNTVWIGFDYGLLQHTSNELKYYTTENGLLSNEVNNVKSDGEDIWIATNGGGISRIMDTVFQSYHPGNCTEMKSSSFSSLFVSENKAIWAGYNKGLTRFCRESWTVFQELNSNKINHSIIKNGVWFATDAGLTHNTDSKWETLTIQNGLINNAVHDVSVDNNENIWIGTKEGVTVVADGVATSFTSREGLINNHIHCTAVDSSGKIWFGTPEGISILEDKKWENITQQDGLISNMITDIETDPAGTIWIATTEGVTKIENEQFTNYTKKEGLPDNRVNTIYIDSTGKKWFGTSEGIATYHNQTWEQITSQEGLPFDTITSISFDCLGDLIVGSNQGLAIREKDGFTVLDETDGLVDNHVNSISCYQKISWISTDDGLTRLERVTNHTPTDITLSQQTIPENTRKNEVIAKLSSVDPDPGNQHYYTLSSKNENNDAASFYLNENQLILDTIADFEEKESYTLNIQTTDQYGASYSKTIQLTVENLPPRMKETVIKMDENQETGTRIGEVKLDDQSDRNSLTYSIGNGNSGDAFTIDSETGELFVKEAVAIDYEIHPEFHLSVIASDGIYTDTSEILIQLNDIQNEGYALIFNVKDEHNNNLGDAEIHLEGYGTIHTFSNGQAIYGHVAAYRELIYTVSAYGYVSDTGTVYLTNSSLEKEIILKKEKKNDQEDEEDDSTSTGIGTIDNEKVMIYPNPARDHFYIKGDRISNRHFFVKNMNGITVYSGTTNQNNYYVPLDNIKKGIYIVEIIFPDQTLCKRIIVR